MSNHDHSAISHSVYQRCPCGWTGTLKQLAVWVRNNKIIAKICPRCGNKAESIKALATSHLALASRAVH